MPRSHDIPSPGSGAQPPDGRASLPTAIGAYRIVSLIGAGSSALVYQARHDRHGVVALKVRTATGQPPAPTGAVSIVTPSRESTALRSLDHPGIARFLDEGWIDSPLGRQAYVAMEFIEGSSCREATTTLDRPARLRFIAAVCDIVHYAHRRGVVHRDLKPENIVVRPNGLPVILDFGLARFLEPDVRMSSITTGIGHLVGTIRYMSPEQAQAQSDRVGPRTDIYSLGVLGYEMLAGELPYAIPSANIPGAILTIASVAARPLGDADPVWRGGVEDIFMRALEKDPALRYRTAAALAADLRRVAAGRRPSPLTPGPSRRRQRDAWNQSLRGARAHVALPWIAGAAVVAGTVGLVLHPPRLAPREPAVPKSLAGLYGVLRTADTQRSEADRTPGRFSTTFTPKTIRRTLALYEEALRLEQKIPPHPTRDAEIRFIHWRRGELYYFLGSILQAPEPLRQSLAAFETARSIPWTLPDSAAAATGPHILAVILQQPAHVVAGGPAIPSSALAAYRDPATNRRRTLAAQRDALRAFQQWEPLLHGREQFRAEDGAYILRALGGDTVELGVLTDSLSLVDDGIRLLRRVDTAAFTPNPRASCFQALGAAWRARAELSGSVADVDSARTWLRQARPLRAAGGEARRTEIELARCAHVASRLSGAAPAKALEHQVARAHLLSALSTLQYGPDPVAEAEIWMLLAQLRMDVVADPEADREPVQVPPPAPMVQLGPARTLLAGAAALLPPERYPVKRASLLVQQSALERALAAAGDGAGHAERVPVLLEAAARLVPAAESPRLHRFIRQGTF